MTINRVKTVSSSTKLKEEPIGVLGSSWSNYSTEITKYNSAFKVGDKVIFSKYAGNEVKLDEEEFIIVKQSDILAVVED